MTDLELIDAFVSKPHPDPFLFRQIESRGLYDIVNYLPNKASEAKAVARARLSKRGIYTGDPEIEQISSTISRLESLRDSLMKIKMVNVHEALPIINEMKEHCEFVNSYFKK